MSRKNTMMLDRLIGSETKAELLGLFHNEPDTSDSIEGLARKLGRSVEEIRNDVEEFVQLGLIQKQEILSFNKKRDFEIQQAISAQISQSTEGEATQVPAKDIEQLGPSRNRLGIPVIDELIYDGYSSPASILILGDPPTGKATLLLQLTANALKQGDRAVYGSLDSALKDVRMSLSAWDVDSGFYEQRQRLLFIDGYSYQTGVDLKERHSVDPRNLTDLGIIVSNVLNGLPSESRIVLVLRSLSTLLQKSGIRASLEFFRSLVAKTKRFNCDLFTDLNRVAFHPAIIAAVQDVVDGVIELKTEEAGVGLSNFLRISKMEGSKHSTAWTPYQFEIGLGLIKAKEKTWP